MIGALARQASARELGRVWSSAAREQLAGRVTRDVESRDMAAAKRKEAKARKARRRLRKAASASCSKRKESNRAQAKPLRARAKELRQEAEEHCTTVRAKGAELAGRAKPGKKRRPRAAAAQSCAVTKERKRAQAKPLRARAKELRQEAEGHCTTVRARAKASAQRRIEPAVARVVELRGAKRKRQAADRSVRARSSEKKRKTTSAERRSENMDAQLANLEPEHHALFRAQHRTIVGARGAGRKEPWEAFLEWLETDEGQSALIDQQEREAGASLDRELERLDRERYEELEREREAAPRKAARKTRPRKVAAQHDPWPRAVGDNIPF